MKVWGERESLGSLANRHKLTHADIIRARDIDKDLGTTIFDLNALTLSIKKFKKLKHLSLQVSQQQKKGRV